MKSGRRVRVGVLVVLVAAGAVAAVPQVQPSSIA